MQWALSRRFCPFLFLSLLPWLLSVSATVSLRGSLANTLAVLAAKSGGKYALGLSRSSAAAACGGWRWSSRRGAIIRRFAARGLYMTSLSHKITSVLMALALAFCLVAPSFFAPKKAEAIAPAVAIPILAGVGAVLATSLAVYGIETVTGNHTTSDVAGEFLAWCSAELEKGGEVASVLADANIHTVQELTNRLYGFAIDGYIDLATLTYNAVNGISSSVDNWLGRLLQLWASDNFGAVSFGTVNIGDLSISTYYSDVNLSDLTSGTINYLSPAKGVIVNEFGEYNYCLQGANNNATEPLSLILASDMTFSFCSTYVQSSTVQSSRLYNSFLVYDASTNTSVPNRYINSFYFEFSNIALNTYYDLYIFMTPYASLDGRIPSDNLHNPSNPTFNNPVAHYSAASGTWETMNAWAGMDVSTALPDAIDYGLWSDAKNLYGDASAADVLDQSIPVSADMVYNPTAGRVLEGQGSIPVVLDWSRVTDWADVLSGTQTGVIDGTRAIDSTSATTAVNTATGEIATSIPLDVTVGTPYLSINPNGGSIAGAMDFAGYSFLDKFPFCTIRDMQLIGDIMNKPSRAPVFYLPVFCVSSGGSFIVESVAIDLAPWEPVAVVLRVMIGLVIILGFLRVATRQLKVFNEE